MESCEQEGIGHDNEPGESFRGSMGCTFTSAGEPRTLKIQQEIPSMLDITFEDRYLQCMSVVCLQWRAAIRTSSCRKKARNGESKRAEHDGLQKQKSAAQNDVDVQG